MKCRKCGKLSLNSLFSKNGLCKACEELLKNNKLWNVLSSKERKIMMQYYRWEFLNSLHSKENEFKFLESAISTLDYIKQFELCDKIVDYLQSENFQNVNPVNLHFFYLHCIDLYYKPKVLTNHNIDKCIYYCKKNIELFPTFKESYIEERREFFINYANSGIHSKEERNELLTKAKNVSLDVNVPSFKRLAIIYEKQGRFNDAIKISELGLSYGLNDGTKGGFIARIERIKKKMKNNT